VTDVDGWEHIAGDWLAWARAPEHDSYWDFREDFFELVPPPGARTLEIGCGEGRVSRDLAARGHRLTAVDASPTLLRAAAEADPAGEYLLADAERLPFEDGSFDLVVAHQVLMDVDDMPAAVREAGRVLMPGGRFCVAVVHPIVEAGAWESYDDDAAFVIAGSYLETRWRSDTIERDGLRMTFAGKTYPLEAYFRALEDAGLLVERLREPPHRPGMRGWGRWSRIPNFLYFRALKLGS
jgi:SAM-dependent methyltransferase